MYIYYYTAQKMQKTKHTYCQMFPSLIHQQTISCKTTKHMRMGFKLV